VYLQGAKISPTQVAKFVDHKKVQLRSGVFLLAQLEADIDENTMAINELKLVKALEEIYAVSEVNNFVKECSDRFPEDIATGCKRCRSVVFIVHGGAGGDQPERRVAVVSATHREDRKNRDTAVHVQKSKRINVQYQYQHQRG